MTYEQRWEEFKTAAREGFEEHKFAYGVLTGEFIMLGIFVVLDSATQSRRCKKETQKLHGLK